MRIKMCENSLCLDIFVTDDNDVRLLNLSHSDLAAPDDSKMYRLLELQASGFDQDDPHGLKQTGTQPASLLRYKTHSVTENEYGKKLELVQDLSGLLVTSHLQFYKDISVVRSWTDIENGSGKEISLEYLTSFALTGIARHNPDPRDVESFVHLPHNAWYGEAQWRRSTAFDLGYMNITPSGDSGPHFTMKRIALSSTGTWSSGEYLPMGAFENNRGGPTYVWQIETSGSWNWEISDIADQLYLQIGGPGFTENSFIKVLKPGDRFESVPCAVAIEKSFESGIQALTKYRRAIRRPNRDNQNPEVIFNDYMNCLTGDPTTEKEIPLIDAAAEAGCKYYCIDCGWYDDGPWWDGVGEWLPSKARFPGGLKEVLDYIRSKGMIAGLWLEIEVMGIKCDLAKTSPMDWFFQRKNKPVIDRSRYQLDFRNPDVCAHANSVIDRVVSEYGVGYIKMDYNINIGAGTDLSADSPGEGLLAHNRAYLKFLDNIFKKYPDLIIENCGSGGMRMDYSLLSRLSLQSVTDQTDYIKMAAIACNCTTAVTPEQAAIWSYPMRSGDVEETVFNMVNAILMRIHQSGHLPELSKKRRAFVHEGIEYHKRISGKLKTGLPFWPIGLATMRDNFLCFGVCCDDIIYLAVWCTKESGKVSIPISIATGKRLEAVCSYPESMPVPIDIRSEVINVQMQGKTARIFEISVL